LRCSVTNQGFPRLVSREFKKIYMKTTKLLAVALASLMIVGCANNSKKSQKIAAESEITNIMKSFDGIEDVEYLEIGGPMLGFAKLALNATPLKSISSDLSKVRILEFDDAEDGVISEISGKVKAALEPYELLVSARDGEDSIEIYANMDENDKITELVLYTGSENAIIAVTGEIDPEDVAKVVDESQKMGR